MTENTAVPEEGEYSPDLNPFPSNPAESIRTDQRDHERGLRARWDVPIYPDSTLRMHVMHHLHPPAKPRRGRVIALVGARGVGKSHLLNSLIEEIRTDQAERTLLWSLEAPPDLLDTFRSQVTALRADRELTQRFERLIERFQGKVLAGMLREGETRGTRAERVRTAEALEAGRADPEKVRDRFGISRESAYLRTRRDLARASDRRLDTHASMALLSQGDRRPEIWDWLAGEPPAQALVDRGVREQISTNAHVCEVLEALAQLHGALGRHCVLVLDSFERALQRPESERAEFTGAFERLVDGFIDAGGLIVFTLQPELLGALSPSLRERVTQVWTAPFTEQETRELVRRRLSDEHGNPPDGTGAFDPSAIAEIHSLGDGLPRRVLRTCHVAWRLAAQDPDQPGARPGAKPEHVSISHVWEAVREIEERTPEREALDMVERALRLEGWPVRRLVVGDASGPSRGDVAFEVQLPQATIRVGVFPSVVKNDDMQQITATVSRESTAPLIVIINGFLARPQRDAIVGLTGLPPLVLGFGPEFGDLLNAALRRTQRNLERNAELARERDRDTLLDKLRLLDRITVDVQETHELLDTLPYRLRPSGRTGAPDGIRRRRRLRGLTTLEAAERSRETETLFDEAAKTLADAAPDFSWRLHLEGGDGLFRPRRVELTHKHIRSLGLIAALTTLLEQLREEVAEVTAQERGGEALRAVCRSFEISAERLPYELLDPAPRQRVLRIVDQLPRRVLATLNPRSEKRP
ncbi:KAP family NTPase [Actinocorallia sp. API 0066]|uniref:KAP family NTPase n=1 Tax=Actinocorallia sp. API 0066 TaxID=2896846 RepID=UPI001E45E9BD|nr:KAP family NTPase [Actinocorallia sp. API 0066]MCD0453143.1 KAP family NTPase [Actinocorallia sp. API 0066]